MMMRCERTCRSKDEEAHVQDDDEVWEDMSEEEVRRMRWMMRMRRIRRRYFEEDE